MENARTGMPAAAASGSSTERYSNGLPISARTASATAAITSNRNTCARVTPKKVPKRML